MNNVLTLTPPGEDPVETVWRHWLEHHARMDHGCYALTPKRKKKIKAALAEYPLETVLAAIEGVKKSDFHMGANSRGKRYNGIETILRDEGTIERHAEALLVVSDEEKLAACPLEARPGESAEAFRVRCLQWWKEQRGE